MYLYIIIIKIYIIKHLIFSYLSYSQGEACVQGGRAGHEGVFSGTPYRATDTQVEALDHDQGAVVDLSDLPGAGVLGTSGVTACREEAEGALAGQKVAGGSCGQMEEAGFSGQMAGDSDHDLRDPTPLGVETCGRLEEGAAGPSSWEGAGLVAGEGGGSHDHP